MSGFLKSAGDAITLGTTTGSVADGYVAFFTGDDSMAGDNDLTYDRINSQLKVGSGTPGHLSTTNHSLYVQGMLEVDSAAYFDSSVLLAYGASVSENRYVGAPSNNSSIIFTNTYQTPDTSQIIPGILSNTWMMNTWANKDVDYGFGLQTNPTFYICSAGSGATTDWLSLTHNQTNGVIDVGSGELELASDVLIDGYLHQDAAQYVKTDLITDSDSPYSVLSTDYCIFVDCSGGAVTIDIPSSQTTNGRVIVIKDTEGTASVNNITITTEGSETIDDENSVTITGDYTAVKLISDGSNWYII